MMCLRTNEEQEAVESLCIATQFADKVDTELINWKWVIIALHNALQGFMVLSLHHSSVSFALSDKSYKDYKKALEEGEPLPDNIKLDTYLGLYKKIKRKKIMEAIGKKRFEPNRTEDENIKKLNSIRNDFIHFLPKDWSLEVNGLPKISLDCLKLIAFLGWNSKNILWKNLDFRDKAKLCWKKLKAQMENLQHLYNEFKD